MEHCLYHVLRKYVKSLIMVHFLKVGNVHPSIIASASKTFLFVCLLPFFAFSKVVLKIVSALYLIFLKKCQ